jgi:flagellin
MTRINTNVAALRGLRSLNKAGGQLDTALTRLSTGLKINSGKDNPAGLIASETLRSQISSIEQSIKNSGRANNVLATADSALGEVGGLLNQIRGLIQETLNSGALSQSEIEANQLQVDAALSAINKISANTSFAGDKLIDGSKAFVTELSASDSAKLADFQVNEALFANTSTIRIEASINQAAEKGELRFVGKSLTQSAAVEVAGSKGSQVIFLGASSTKANVRDSINSISDVTGVKATFEPGATFDLGSTKAFTDSATAATSDTATVTGQTFDIATVSDGSGNTIAFRGAAAGGSAGTTASPTISIVFAATTANSQTLAVSVSAASTARTITVHLGTDASGVETSSYSAIIAAIKGDATAGTLVAATTTAGSTVGAAVASTSLAGGTTVGSSTVSFTRKTAGAGGTTAQPDVNIVFATTTGASQTLRVTTSAASTARTVTVYLATDAGGVETSNYDEIIAAIRGNTTANSLVNATTTGGTSVATGFASTALTGGIDAGLLKISDNRNNGSGGSAATLGGSVNVQIGDFATGTTAASLGVNSFSVDAETGAVTLKIQLAKTAGEVTSTLASVESFINSPGTTVDVNGTATQLNEFVLAEATGGTTGLATASSVVSELRGGNDGANNGLTFYDNSAVGTAGQARVAFTDPGTAGQALSVNVSSVTGTSDKLVTFTLATDANGNVTTTAEDIANLLQTGTTSGAAAARDLVSVSVEGNGKEVIGEAATQGTKTLDVASRILKLQSTDFGSDAFVQFTTITGSFDTVGTDNATRASRDAGLDLQATINGQVVESRGLTAKIRTSTLDASLSFNETNNVSGRRAVITITGGGSLFQIGQQANSSGQIGIGIEAVNTARLGGVSGKLYELGTGGGKSLLDISPEKPGSTLVNIVEEAINRVSTLRGRLGAVQRNVIDTNVTTLGVALENISEARSVITDTDFAETTAEMTKAQILNQAGISVLSIANQNPQQVLNLLG